MKFIQTFLLLSFCFSLSAQTLSNIEAVEYDPAGNRFLITNGDEIIQRASDGTLSFFGDSNASATHGMEVVGNILCAIDGGTVRFYELDTENYIVGLNIPGAGFLNGMANDGTNVYVTDFSNNSIYKITGVGTDMPFFSEIVSNTGGTPNGITYDQANNRLIFVSWGGSAPIKAVDLTDNSVTTLTTTSLGNCDGIDDDNDGNYYVSSWSPTRISKFNGADFSEAPETITAPGLANPADISYAKEIDTLAIANSGNNTVTYLGFGPPPVSNLNLEAEALNFQVYPNPVTEQSAVHFELQNSTFVELALYDQMGKQTQVLLKGQQNAGKNKVLLAGLDLETGVYHCVLKIDGQQVSERIFIQ